MRGDLLVQQRDSPQRDQSASTFEKLIISSEIKKEKKMNEVKTLCVQDCMRAVLSTVHHQFLLFSSQPCVTILNCRIEEALK